MTTPLITQETTKGQAICPYCGVGCRLLMESANGELIRVREWPMRRPTWGPSAPRERPCPR